MREITNLQDLNPERLRSWIGRYFKFSWRLDLWEIIYVDDVIIFKELKELIVFGINKKTGVKSRRNNFPLSILPNLNGGKLEMFEDEAEMKAFLMLHNL